jgi:hypothetical protein
MASIWRLYVEVRSKESGPYLALFPTVCFKQTYREAPIPALLPPASNCALLEVSSKRHVGMALEEALRR